MHKTKHLSTEDLDRLHYAAARQPIDPNESLFGPESVTWRINREGVILLGGGCALLLQVAHPLVAAGVETYSSFRTDPLKRLWRTLELMLTIVFASASEAIAAVRTIEKMHARVRGEIDASAGPFPSGAQYNANNPELQFWVHATLVHTALQVYEMFVGPLDEKAATAYYEESKITARLFGVPESLIPPRLADFRRYWQDMIAGETLAVSAASRAVADSILSPPLPIGVKQVFQLPHLLTIGLLPQPVRERYGYWWTFAHEAALSALVTTGQLTLPWLPEFARVIPAARHAAARTLAAA